MSANMKQFENKVLFIKDEPMMEEVRKLILDSGFKICKSTFFLSKENLKANNLTFLESDEDFGLTFKLECEQEITLEQFKELLKQK